MKALCFLLMRYYGLVKVVNNASGTRLAGSYSQTGMQGPIESECKIPTSRSGAERVSGVSLILPRAPYIIQPRVYGVYKPLIKQQQKQVYRLRNVRAGYVLYSALV